jgi:hypothetical protein
MPDRETASGALRHTRAVRTLARRPLLLAAAWFLVVAVVVAGPLLGGGYLALLDFVSGPHVARPDPVPLPSSGDVGNTAPLVALHASIAALAPTLPDKLLLVAPVLLGGLGAWRLLSSRLGCGFLAALYGGTLFAVNPFVRDRYLAGHLYLLLGYGLLPWAMAAPLDLLRLASRTAVLRCGAWLAGLAIVSLHVAGAYALLVLLAVALAPARPLRRIALGLGTAALAAVLCAYWLLPDLVAAPRRAPVPPDLDAYAARPEGAHVLATLASLHGFWRDEFPPPAVQHPALFVLLAPIVALAAIGFGALLRSPLRRTGVTLAVAAAVGLLGAAGTAWRVSEPVFRGALEHAGPLGLYREPQKLVLLLALAYALLGAAGLAVASAAVRSPMARVGAGLAATAVAVGYGSSLLWGIGGDARLARYPASWDVAQRALDQRGDTGTLLVLPWRLYGVWSLAPDRILANPAASFFGRELLVSDDPGVARGRYRSPDGFREYVTVLLARRSTIDQLGRLLAPLDVRFVAALEGADERFLLRQGDLSPVHRSPGLLVLENAAWRRTLPLAAIARPPAGLAPRSTDRASTRALPLVRRLPAWREIPPGDRRPIAVGERCDDGWLLGEQEPRCHLGVAAAFAPPPRTTELWRPRAGLGLLGYLIALAGWALAATAALRARGRPALATALPRRAPRAAVAFGVVGAVSLGTYLALAADRGVSVSAPARGASCAALADAAVRRAQADAPGLRAAVDRAAAAALAALDTSGSSFGDPEAAALELDARLDAGAGVGDGGVIRLLREAERACRALGR